MLAQIWKELPSFLSSYNLTFLASAALATIGLSAIGSMVGVAVGFVLAVVRITRGAYLLPLRLCALAFTETFRRVPFLVTLMLVFFCTQAGQLDLPLFVVGLISVCLIAAAYLSEIVRAGFMSIQRQQWDAAASMNFTLMQTIRSVVLPQALPVILPPAFSFFVLFIKDTALASQIGIIELTYAGKVLNNKGFSAVLVFGTMLLLYFVISYPLAHLGQSLEKRFAASRHR